MRREKRREKLKMAKKISLLCLVLTQTHAVQFNFRHFQYVYCAILFMEWKIFKQYYHPPLNALLCCRCCWSFQHRYFDVRLATAFKCTCDMNISFSGHWTDVELCRRYMQKIMHFVFEQQKRTNILYWSRITEEKNRLYVISICENISFDINWNWIISKQKGCI